MGQVKFGFRQVNPESSLPKWASRKYATTIIYMYCAGMLEFRFKLISTTSERYLKKIYFRALSHDFILDPNFPRGLLYFFIELDLSPCSV